MSVESETFEGGGPDAVFREALARGTIRLQRCLACGKSIFYPRLLCHHCGSPRLEWFTPTGRGRVHSTSTVRVRPERGASYNISLVELEEGPRLMSRVVDVAVDDVKIDMPVVAFVGEIDSEPVVLFRPDSQPAGA